MNKRGGGGGPTNDFTGSSFLRSPGKEGGGVQGPQEERRDVVGVIRVWERGKKGSWEGTER